jgi:type I restriction enzyme S subunit
MADEWKPIRLGDVCAKIGSGATPRGGSDVYLSSGPYALIRSQNVYNDGFHHDGLAYIDEQHAFELANVEVLEGDVLLNITGDSVARACQVDPRVLPARVNQHVAIIRPDPRELDPRFLRYFLVSPAVQTTLLSWAGSGGTRNALTKGMIESFEVSAPKDVAEQRAIAHILGTLDGKIELNRRMSETLEAMARALFKSWFVDFDPVRAKTEGRDPGLPKPLDDLFPARLVDSELGEIPEGWTAPQLSDVLTESNERVGDWEAPEYSSTNDGLQLRSERFKKTLAASPANNKLIRNGFMVFGLSRRVLNFGLMRDEIGSVSSAYKVLQVNENVVSADLLERLMRLHSNYFYNAVSASSREGQSVSTEGLGLLRFVLPPKAVQEAFYAWGRPLRARMQTLDLESVTLSSLRDTLLPNLISGDLRVRNAEAFIERVG